MRTVSYYKYKFIPDLCSCPELCPIPCGYVGFFKLFLAQDIPG
ncbi:hypothetical protein M6B38_376300 [Iris pallida]|uniref:Uncharacterized protein n=1 Tax=Iris pallida TaxID=29817 RepID=A0AAX6EEV0_IRIPA|nr:hypothetical protein M6B38_194100 [Iris pallida]KAJ6825469.1 hypothetical protein M6B38_376300 [Iris pallida]